MFVDEVKIHAKAGDGGNGIVSWLHDKGKEYGGPAGGDGGKGGNVYAKAVRDIGVLTKYRFEKEFKAGRGGDGRGKTRHGGNGSDLELLFPVGSVITNEETRKEIELLLDGERVLLLSGGSGGYGNEHFKGSRNVRPKRATPGKGGEEADFSVELRLVADAGIIGFPNAGKSSLLNALTNAHAKIGAYAFTTLEPNLGDMHGFILADIPGLIEGASEGRGLGHMFLRHIERTKVLFHCISLEHKDELKKIYATIREELSKFDSSLAGKKEIVILTKADLASGAEMRQAFKELAKAKIEALSVSVADAGSVKKLKDDLVKILRAL